MGAADVTLGQAPSPSVMVAGTEIFLPPSARVDLAYQWTYQFADATTAAYGQTVNVPGGYYEILLAATMQYTASASAGIRNQSVQIEQPQKSPLQYGNAFAQTANNEITWTWGVGITAAGANTLQGFGFIPLPPAFIQPGGFFSILTSGQTGDIVSAVNAVTLRIPTGPNATRPEIVPTVTLT